MKNGGNSSETRAAEVAHRDDRPNCLRGIFKTRITPTKPCGICAKKGIWTNPSSSGRPTSCRTRPSSPCSNTSTSTIPKPSPCPNAVTTRWKPALKATSCAPNSGGWYAQTDEELGRALAGYYGNISQMDACIGKVLDTLYDSASTRTPSSSIPQTTAKWPVPIACGPNTTCMNNRSAYHSSSACPETSTPTPRTITSSNTWISTPHSPNCATCPSRKISTDAVLPLYLTTEPTSRANIVYSEYDFCHSVFTRDNRYVGKPPILMVRTDRWKLNYLSWARSELFDLENDPNEFRNVIDDPANASIARELTDIAKRMYEN